MDVFRSLALDAETTAEEPVFALDAIPEEVSMCFMRACRKAGILDCHFHDLRHTHASWLRQRSVQLDKIAAALGHSSTRMAEKCAHLGPSQVRESINGLDAILKRLESAEPKTDHTEGVVTRLQ